MTTDPLTKEVSSRICKHMNDDHADAVLSLAIHFGEIKGPKKATMVNITEQEIALEVDGRIIQIAFTTPISNSKEAHKTLVEMLNEIPKPNQ